MKSLYLDSSEHLVIGLLDQDFNWLEYSHLETQKNSKHIHKLIHEICEKNNIKAKEIDQVIQNSGPGSYTGMRLTEGITQVFEWQNIKALSFYHFDVPKFLGVDVGRWVSKAFKGEFFIYEWDKDTSSKSLVSKDDYKFSEGDYTHFDTMGICSDFKYTSELIHQNSKELFSLVQKRDQRVGPFYYRELEKEFTPSNI